MFTETAVSSVFPSALAISSVKPGNPPASKLNPKIFEFSAFSPAFPSGTQSVFFVQGKLSLRCRTMDFSIVMDPVYILMLVFSILVIFGIHAIINRVSPNTAPIAVHNDRQPAPLPERPVLGDAAGDEAAEESDSSDEEDVQNANPALPKMMGKKKRLKMERKAALKEYRKYQLDQSKERQVEEKKRIKELRKSEKSAEKEQAEQDEAWEKYIEEKRQQEEEEYQSWKHTMTVQESGSGESEKDVLAAQSDRIIALIQHERSIILESLSARFQATTAAMVDLLTRLVSEGRLEGVFDEHGKFIYVTREDRLKLAKIVQRRGRVGIGELTREANALISIDPLNDPEPEPSSSSSVFDPVASSSTSSS